AGREIEEMGSGAGILQCEEGGARRPTGAEHKNLCALKLQTHLQRSYHTRDVCIEAVEFSILGADDRIAGADFGGEWIGLVQMFQNLFLVRHGDAQTVNGNVIHACHQVAQSLGVQGKIDGIYILAAKSNVQHGRGEEMDHWISSHPIHAGGSIHLIDSISILKSAGSNLPRSSFLAGTNGPEGKLAAGANCQHPADDSLFTHAQADHRMLIAVAFQKLHHYNVVREGIGRADDLEE